MPIRPDKVEQMKTLGQLLSGPRSEEYRASNRKQKVRREMWYLQKTDNGYLLVVYFDAEDPAKAVEIFLKSNDPFDVWERKQLAEITGLDLSKPEPLPENIMTIVVR